MRPAQLRRTPARLEVRALKRLALVSIVVSVLAVFVGYGAAAPGGHWVLTDIGAQADRAFPDYTGLGFLGMTSLPQRLEQTQLLFRELLALAVALRFQEFAQQAAVLVLFRGFVLQALA